MHAPTVAKSVLWLLRSALNMQPVALDRARRKVAPAPGARRLGSGASQTGAQARPEPAPAPRVELRRERVRLNGPSMGAGKESHDDGACFFPSAGRRSTPLNARSRSYCNVRSSSARRCPSEGPRAALHTCTHTYTCTYTYTCTRRRRRSGRASKR